MPVPHPPGTKVAELALVSGLLLSMAAAVKPNPLWAAPILEGLCNEATCTQETTVPWVLSLFLASTKQVLMPKALDS